jgi:CSLREA domain-containing protein
MKSHRLAILAIGIISAPSFARATTFTVTDVNDNTAANTKCSLREALNAHNNHSYSADCRGTGSSLDYINLAGGQTYNVSSMLHVTGGQLVIHGVSTNKPTISAAANTNIWGLYVDPGNNQLWLEYVRVTGFKGPAILADQGASAYVDWCEVTANNFSVGNGQSASVVAYPGGYVELYGSSVHHNTGAIKGGGLLIYQNANGNVLGGTIIESNTSVSQYGGGVMVMGYFYCDDGSVIRMNSADISGGGIYKSPTGVMDLPNCMVYGNTAPSDPNIHM